RDAADPEGVDEGLLDRALQSGTSVSGASKRRLPLASTDRTRSYRGPRGHRAAGGSSCSAGRARSRAAVRCSWSWPQVRGAVEVERRTGGPDRIGRGEPEHGGGHLLGATDAAEGGVVPDRLSGRGVESVGDAFGLDEPGGDRRDGDV